MASGTVGSHSRSHRSLVARLLLVAGGLLAATAASAEDCPAPLREARQLAVVSAAGMNALKAELTMFTRSAVDQPWSAVGAKGPAVVGLSGLAWGWPYRHLAAGVEPVKREGDKRTPLGIFRLGAAFGHNASPLPGYVQLAAGRNFCVDDVRSVHYGRIVDKSAAGAGTSGEDMATIDIYRRGVVVDYPTDRAAKAGSCIFVHLWRSESKGTTGCVALPEPALANLQQWSARAPTAIAIVSADVRSRFGGCLPK